MKYIPIQTAQNVQIQVGLASVGERILAFLIDLFIKISYIFTINLLGFSSYLSNLYDDPWSATSIQILVLMPVIFYTLCSEALTNGSTIGKKILKIRVISLDSYKTKFDQYFIRWIFNLLDVFTFSGIIGLLSALVTKKSQRLGDLSAGTAVVKVNKKVSINDSIFMEVREGYKAMFPTVTLLTDRDVQIIKTTYFRAKKNNDYKTIKLIRQKIDQILNVPSSLNDYQFIERVLEDYNYITKDLT